jgi:hypothetical protein
MKMCLNKATRTGIVCGYFSPTPSLRTRRIAAQLETQKELDALMPAILLLSGVSEEL